MKKFGAKKIGALAIAMALVTVGGVYATWTYTDGSTSSIYDNVYITLATATESGTTTNGTYEVSHTVGSASKIFTIDQYSFAKSELYDETENSSGIYDYVIVYNPNGGQSGLGEAEVLSYNSTPSYSYDKYTAALCISHGAAITVTFNANSGTTAYTIGTDTYFSFSWSGDQPTVYLDTTYGYYPASSGTQTDVINLDTDAHYIFNTTETVPNVERVWATEDSYGNSYGDGVFKYIIDTEEMCEYFKMNAYIVAATIDQYNYLESGIGSGTIKITITEAGTKLGTPTVTYTTNTGSEGLQVSSAVSNASGYRVGFFNAVSDGTPLYKYDFTTVGTDITFNNMITSLSSFADGTYYIRVRAISDSASYSNSEWSAISYSIVVSGGSVTSMSAI